MGAKGPCARGDLGADRRGSRDDPPVGVGAVLGRGVGQRERWDDYLRDIGAPESAFLPPLIVGTDVAAPYLHWHTIAGIAVLQIETPFEPQVYQ